MEQIMTANTYKHLLMALMLGGALSLGACSGDSNTPAGSDSAASPGSSMLAANSEADPDDSAQAPAASDNPVVVMETSMGTIEIELWSEEAPVSVENFLRYVDNNLYNNLTFHRVIPGFMIQGGGYDANFVEISGYPAIRNEARPGLRNDRGTLAMARTNVVDSATSQFFINLVDNDFLNQRSPSPQEFGYAVFGRVISGMEVVDQIARVETTSRRGHQDVPVEAVTIIATTRR
jgi:peptidyl-prolyl cis-trans isomerase A (cyclophilin A)